MPSSEAVDLLAAPDPLAAFEQAHRQGRLLALATSGSTDRPRTILRTTESWVASFPHISDLLGLEPSSRVWIPGPATATMNLFAAAHARWAGATHVADPEDATHAHLTPTALSRELATRPTTLAGVHVITAGDRLDPGSYTAASAAGVKVSHYW